MENGQRDDLLQKRPRKTENVDVPELNKTFIVRALSAGERDEYEGSMAELRDGKPVFNHKDTRAKLIVRGVVDETGKLMYSNADIPAISDQDPIIIDRLASVICRLSGIKAGIKLDDAAKN